MSVEQFGSILDQGKENLNKDQEISTIADEGGSPSESGLPNGLDEKSKDGRELLKEEQLFNIQIIEKFMSLPELDGLPNPYHEGIKEAPNLCGYDKDGYPYMIVPIASSGNVSMAPVHITDFSTAVVMAKEGTFLLEFRNRRFDSQSDDIHPMETFLPNADNTIQTLESLLKNNSNIVEINNVSDGNEPCLDTERYLSIISERSSPSSMAERRENYKNHIDSSYVVAQNFPLGESTYDFFYSKTKNESKTGVLIIKEAIIELSHRLDKKRSTLSSTRKSREELLNSI